MLKIGEVLDGKYKILNEIGRGGMSIVYMALNEKANKTWAVKEVRKDGKMNFNTVRQGLIAEIETLKRLKHPNLPSIVDVIEDDESFIIVMDYIEGRSLDKIIQENGAQPESIVVEWAKQLCDVFNYLHTLEPPIIYRDLKPANIMLKPDGNITLIDFGTAKNYEIDLGETTGIGTIGYAAPEQYIGSGLGRTDQRTDIFCLGMTLYHLLTNVDPCREVIYTKSIREVNPSLSHSLDNIIVKCTNDNPEERYQNCAELLYDLENYTNLEPLYKKKQKHKLQLFVGVALSSLIFLSMSGGFYYASTQQASADYQSLLFEANKSNDYDKKINLYKQCIDVVNMAGKKDAYLGLIQTFKDNDSALSVEESQTLITLINNNKESLLKDKQAYTEVCFETGKLVWYYYDYGNTENNQITKAKSAVEWFQDVMEYAPEDYENLGMAKVYANIGLFYRNITTNVVEASDRGKYKPLFEDLKSLMTKVAVDKEENEIVRLELVELMRTSLQQYATKLKIDKVSKNELVEMYDLVKEISQTIETTTDKTTAMKKEINALLPDTLNTINLAYETNDGGDQ